MNKRTYSVFVKEGARYARITPSALKLDSARRAFQNMLLGGSLIGLNMSLRPAEEDYERADEYRANMERFFPKIN